MILCGVTMRNGMNLVTKFEKILGRSQLLVFIFVKIHVALFCVVKPFILISR